jgi:hypothetical protein
MRPEVSLVRHRSWIPGSGATSECTMRYKALGTGPPIVVAVVPKVAGFRWHNELHRVDPPQGCGRPPKGRYRSPCVPAHRNPAKMHPISYPPPKLVVH